MHERQGWPGGMAFATVAALAVFALGRFSAPAAATKSYGSRLTYLEVRFDVRPERREDFLAAIRANEAQTNAEPLNKAFLWGESTEVPNRFYFHEEYYGTAGVEAHMTSAHVAEWEEFVETDPFSGPIVGPFIITSLDSKTSWGPLPVDAGMSPWAYVLAVVSAFTNAIFFTPNRLESVKKAGIHPIIYNWYTTFGVFIFSWLVAFTILPVAGLEPVIFTPAGFAGGALFTCALLFSCLALDQIGLSLGLGIWCGMATLVSFLWGTIGPSNIARPLLDTPLSVAGISLIIAGILGIINVESLGNCFCKCLADPPLWEVLGDDKRGEPEAEPPASAGSRLLGTVYALAVGLFGGSMLVPLSFLPAEFAGIKGLGFIPSFGTGSFMAGTTFAILLRVAKGPVTLAPAATLWAGIVSGSIWQLGNVCQVVAQSYYGLPYAISYPIFQASLVFGGFLGIVLFKEIQGTAPIAFFFFSAVIVVGGSLLLALYGPTAA